MTSETPEELLRRDAAPDGVFYSLPHGVVDLILSVDPAKAKFTFDVSEAIFVPDSRHRYYVRYKPLANYDDQVTVTVSPGTSFLKSINATSEDKTKDIIVNLAQSFSALTGFEEGETTAASVELRKMRIDPLNDKEREHALGLFAETIGAYVRRQNEACAVLAGDKKARNALSIDDSIAYYEEVMDKARRRLVFLNARTDRLAQIKKYALEKFDLWQGGKDLDFGILTKFLMEVCTIDREPKVEPSPLAPPKTPGKKLQNDVACRAITKNIGKDDPNGGADPDDSKRRRRFEALRAKLLEEVNIRVLYWGDATADAQKDIDKAKTKRDAVNTTKDEQGNLCKKYKDLAKERPVPVMKVQDYRERASTALSRKDVPDWEPVKTEIAARPLAESPARTDCSVGVCYRPKEPYKIVWGIATPRAGRKAQLANIADVEIDDYDFEGNGTRILDLPNNAPLVAIDINRAFLVKKVNDIMFDENGFLSKVRIEKPSELVALTSLPLAVISALADGLAIRVSLINTQRDLAKKEAELLKAQANLRKARSGIESGTVAEGALPRVESGRRRGTEQRSRGVSNTFGAPVASSGGAGQ